jgi:hypothetical protein
VWNINRIYLNNSWTFLPLYMHVKYWQMVTTTTYKMGYKYSSTYIRVCGTIQNTFKTSIVETVWDNTSTNNPTHSWEPDFTKTEWKKNLFRVDENFYFISKIYNNMIFFTSVLGYITCDRNTSKELRDKQNKNYRRLWVLSDTVFIRN